MCSTLPEAAGATAGLAPTPSLETRILEPDVGRSGRPAPERPLVQALSTDSPRSSHFLDRDLLKRPSAAADRLRRGDCDPTAFAGLSGPSLIEAITAASVDCVNRTFSLTGTVGAATFSEPSMVTVAQALLPRAEAYPGDNRDGILQLILFLRAGFYVQFYQPGIPDYSPALRAALRPGMDAFAASPQFGRVDDVHGEILTEFAILVDSANDAARYLDNVVRRLLASYDEEFAAFYWMRAAVNANFYTLSRGHQFEDFRQRVAADSGIVEELHGFALRHLGLLGGPRGYLVHNAGRVLGGFLRYDGNTGALTRSRLRDLAARSDMLGPTAGLWMGIAEMVDYYDSENCADYGTCGFRDRVLSEILGEVHDCGGAPHLRVQRLNATQRSWVCSQLLGLDAHFHQRMATQRQPVANDYNVRVEVIVMASADDYDIYAGPVYGISTNNGGIYIEGQPSDPGNVARLFVYELGEGTGEGWQIWNLHHEYVHYLDSRYNLAGSFCDYPLGGLCGEGTPDGSAIWYMEGLAEHLAYDFRRLSNRRAVQDALVSQTPLARIFEASYASSSIDVYVRSFLASRFLLEVEPEWMQSLLALFRAGNMGSYVDWVGAIGDSADSRFASWVRCFANHPVDSSRCHPEYLFDSGFEITPALPECDFSSPQEVGHGCQRSGLQSDSQLHFFLWLPQGIQRLRVESLGGSGNADLYLRHDAWAYPDIHDASSTGPGNDEHIEIELPQAGYWYVLLNASEPFTAAQLRVWMQ